MYRPESSRKRKKCHIGRAFSLFAFEIYKVEVSIHFNCFHSPTMFAVRSILFVVLLFNCQKIVIGIDDCPADNIDFATKVANSSIVVYGKSVGKTLYDENDSLFYITYVVDCILKGPVVSRQINITQAGQIKGRTYCQDYPVGRGYSIAFLEPNPENITDTKTFIPADFAEVPFVRNVTNEILVNTCHLQRILPFESTDSITDVCPIVSTSAECIALQSTTITNAIVVPGGAQIGVDNIKSKSGTAQVHDENKGVDMKSINLALLFITVVFILFN